MEVFLIALIALALAAYLLSAIAEASGKAEGFTGKLITLVAIMALVAYMCLKIVGFKGVVQDMWHGVTNHNKAVVAAMHDTPSRVRPVAKLPTRPVANPPTRPVVQPTARTLPKPMAKPPMFRRITAAEASRRG